MNRIPGHSTNILKSLLKLISDLSPHGKVPDKPGELGKSNVLPSLLDKEVNLHVFYL